MRRQVSRRRGGDSGQRQLSRAPRQCQASLETPQALLLVGRTWNAPDVVQRETQIFVEKLELVFKRGFDEIGFGNWIRQSWSLGIYK